MLSIKEACNILHVDIGNNDELITSLCESIPGYIETSTGYPESAQDDEPLCRTVSGFLLTLWYYSDHTDDVKLQRTIDNLLKCLAIKARSVNG